ncbi:MAG: ABC transporter permease subunit [Firmicutes bacterium]|nr:ABC transporter permease subunit [Bacillota bacterium]
MENLIRIATLGALTVLILMIMFIVKQAVACFYQLDVKCIFGLPGLIPLSGAPRYSILLLIINSFLVGCGATVIALFFGIITSLYITEIASPRVARLLWIVLKGIGAIPPVVIGFLGIVVLLKYGPQLGVSYILWFVMASLLLSLQAYPSTVCFLTDTLRRIPASFKASSYALGATRWQTIAHTIYPAARPGIAAAGLFVFGRVLGDTVILLMLAQVLSRGQQESVRSFLTIPAAIALEAPSIGPGDPQYHIFYLLGLLLTAISFGLSYFRRRLLRTQRGELE